MHFVRIVTAATIARVASAKRASSVALLAVVAAMLAAGALGASAAEPKPPLVPASQPPVNPNAADAPTVPTPGRPDTAPAPAKPPACTINGTNRADVLRGTAKSDVICGRGGADRLFARGSDVLVGGAGADVFSARNGLPDLIYGGAGKDRATVDTGLDVLVGVERSTTARAFSAWHPATALPETHGPSLPARGVADTPTQAPFGLPSRGGYAAHPMVGHLENQGGCTGTLVAKNIVLTAGHCVYYFNTDLYNNFGICQAGATGDFAGGSVTFKPGQRGDSAPYTYFSRDYVIHDEWKESVDRCNPFFPFDYAYIVLRPDTVGVDAGTRLGWRGIAPNYQGTWFWSIGYPGTGHFASAGGRYQYYCLSQLGDGTGPLPDYSTHTWTDGSAWYELGIGCWMTGGASGGPWLVDAGRNGKWEYIASVNSHCWAQGRFCKDSTADNMWGPYLTQSAVSLLEYAKRL